eukprot:scaffold24274_cov146-Isochrysis_galbana.AAC.7
MARKHKHRTAAIQIEHLSLISRATEPGAICGRPAERGARCSQDARCIALNTQAQVSSTPKQCACAWNV